MPNPHTSYVNSSGNVYQDMGFVDAEDRFAKSSLAIHISELIDRYGLEPVEVADVLGISQTHTTALANGHLSNFSLENLIHFLKLLNQDVVITIKSKHDKPSVNKKFTGKFTVQPT